MTLSQVIREKLITARIRAQDHTTLDCLDALEVYIDVEMSKQMPMFPQELIRSTPVGTVTRRKKKGIVV